MKREPGVYCEHVLQDDVAVAYLRGDLGEAERDVYEQHYFECADCFERLQVMRALPAVLRQEGAARRRPARAPMVATWAWAAGVAFVAVAAAFVLRGTVAPHPGPGPSPAASPSSVAPGAGVSPGTPDRPPLDVLARVEPPPYALLVVRGGEGTDGAFSRAMERYVHGDYAGAAADLRAAVREEPDSVEARFYLGVTELLAGRPEAAIRELRRVAAGSDPAFAEAARYYIAKGRLARGEVAAARRELQIVARGDGDHRQKAELLLRQLGAEP
jgi:tetratricopeptide (TPR) repeat protein